MYKLQEVFDQIDYTQCGYHLGRCLECIAGESLKTDDQMVKDAEIAMLVVKAYKQHFGCSYSMPTHSSYDQIAKQLGILDSHIKEALEDLLDQISMGTLSDPSSSSNPIDLFVEHLKDYIKSKQ